MCLDYFHFLLQDPPLSFLSTQLCVFFGGVHVFLKIKTNLCWSNIPGGVIFHCSMVDLAGATLLDKFISPFPSSYHLPIAPHQGERILVSLSWCWHVVWLELVQVWYMLSQCLWVHMYSHSAVSISYCFPGIIYPSDSYKSRWFFSVGKMGCNTDILFRAEHSAASCSLYLN